MLRVGKGYARAVVVSLFLDGYEDNPITIWWLQLARIPTFAYEALLLATDIFCYYIGAI